MFLSRATKESMTRGKRVLINNADDILFKWPPPLYNVLVAPDANIFLSGDGLEANLAEINDGHVKRNVVSVVSGNIGNECRVLDRNKMTIDDLFQTATWYTKHHSKCGFCLLLRNPDNALFVSAVQ